MVGSSDLNPISEDSDNDESYNNFEELVSLDTKIMIPDCLDD